MKPILIIGDSHVGALKRAYDAHHKSLKHEIHFYPLGDGSKARAPFSQITPDGTSISTEDFLNRPLTLPLREHHQNESNPLYAISFPLNTSRILRDYDWSNFVPWNLRRSPQETAISDATLHELFETDLKHALAFVRQLASTKVSLVIVEGPRFFPDSHYLSRVRVDVALEVSERYRDYARQQLAEMSIPIICQPSFTITSQGMTDMRYNHENPADQHHANAEFGRLMIQEICRYAEAC